MAEEGRAALQQKIIVEELPFILRVGGLSKRGPAKGAGGRDRAEVAAEKLDVIQMAVTTMAKVKISETTMSKHFPTKLKLMATW